MKFQKQLPAVLILLTLTFLFSCSSGKINIRGNFTGLDRQMLYLEKVSPLGNTLVDSVKTDAKGNFRLGYHAQTDEPVFLNIRMSNGQYIALLAAPGDNIKISSLGNIPMNYRVDGSEDSELIRQLNTSMARSYHQIDSLQKILELDPGDTVIQDVTHEISRIYVKQKQENISFIIRNANSLASVMALYQQMPNGIIIFGDRKDFTYFSIVADSLTARYPNSPHVIALRNDVEQTRSQLEFQAALENTLEQEGIDFPEIEMKDLTGQVHRLSSLKGNVILLTFWSAETQNSNMLNRELVELYNRFHKEGFEIFQVSLDTSRTAWINALREQKLPWINVCDFNGSASYAARIYNVTSIPANYLIDRNAHIVEKNVWGDQLAGKIRQLL